jgi:phosphohistidine phosphatase
MQREIVIVRHAKTESVSRAGDDFSRTLTAVGERDAEAMGRFLKEQGIKPELILASSAKRTRRTSKILAAAMGLDGESIRYEEKLYLAADSLIETEVMGVPDSVGTLVVVGHNPGITDFVNRLSPDFILGHLPTCGLVAAKFESESWADFPAAIKTITLIKFPKHE